MMTGIEIAVATYLFTWAKHRGKTLVERTGQEADAASGLLMDRLHQLVVDKLGPRSQGLERLEREATAGADEPGETTGALVAASLTAAMEDDPAFADALHRAVAELRAAESRDGNGTCGGGVAGNVFRGPAAVQTGHHNQQTNRFGM
jgi:hypothetical protein